MKKIVSFCLLITILLSMNPFAVWSATDSADNEMTVPQWETRVKDGYTLVPLSFSAAGISAASSFLLTVPESVDVGELELTIDGQPNPIIEKVKERELLITPAARFLYNSLYIFRLAREGKSDITWAFQTVNRFQITSGFPGNQAVNVPVSTGIEITFSSEDHSPINDYFSISPNAAGEFIQRGNTTVFVPRRDLRHSTVYTVTVKAGVRHSGTNEEISDDYTFSFGTEPAPQAVHTAEQFRFFSSVYAEFPTIEAPAFNTWRSWNSSPRKVNISVYRFGGKQEAIDAVYKKQSVPFWARFAGEDSFVETAALSKVMSFVHEESGDRTFQLPDALTGGFYLIDAEYENSHDQMIIQITDLPVQIISDKDMSIVWVNDIVTGRAVADADVYDTKTGKTYITDVSGVAKIDRPVPDDGNETLVVTARDGKECVWLHSGFYNSVPNNPYWTVLQLDRTLFKGDDTVSFFGFVQNRGDAEEINHVSAVLTRGAFSFWGTVSSRDTLHRQTVPVSGGVYSDEMRLPNLDQGSYQLTIYHGDLALGSVFLSVQEYVKPPYTLEVSADRRAAFADETVTFTAKAGFFDGTPLPELDISYRLSGYLLAGSRGTVKTGFDGSADVRETIRPQEDAQGQTTFSFAAEATLPEIGWTHQSESVRVFVNDIDVAVRAVRDEANARLTATVSSITLDRLNDGTALHSGDFLDRPAANQELSVDIFRMYWVRSIGGRYYSHTEKRTIPWYTYTSHGEQIDSFTITTGADGTAAMEFTVPNRERESYFAKITCLDGNGRTITQDVFIGRDYSNFFWRANENAYYLDGAKEGYDIGDEVNLTLMRGTGAVTGGNFLFYTMQDGIIDLQAGKNPYSFVFSIENKPNVFVYAHYFDGFNYQSNYRMQAGIRYDTSNNELTITAKTDKDSYKPGDMCTVTIAVHDKDGRPKEAFVNLSIVDEALFALRDYKPDTLALLYRNLNPGRRFVSSTHRFYVPSDSALDEGNMADSDYPAAVPPQSPAPGGGSGDETYLRELFEDTALFATVRSDAHGQAVYTFKLPDNITSWRLTMSGISGDLFAGNNTQNIVVTMPMFLHYTLNSTFLIGDKPTIGINAYGTALTGGETILFEVWEENNPDRKYTETGAAFERVNIPLWEMAEEGAGGIIIQATVIGGAGDMVRHRYQALRTYRETDAASYYDVTENTVFETGAGRMTNITFTDRGRGQYLYRLIGMLWAWGDRIERLAAAREAERLIAEYFPDLSMSGSGRSFDPKKYQQADGGISILPHAASDVETTVRMMPFLIDDVNFAALRSYLYNIYEGDNADNKMTALYGLAMMKEPVLVDINNYALLENMHFRDAVYIALAYCELGETESAGEIFNRIVAPNIQNLSGYSRVNIEGSHWDITEATSAAALLALKLDRPEKEGLHQYAVDYSGDILINLERLIHIRSEIEKADAAQAGITYTLFGETFTRELSRFGHNLRIPVANFDEFKLIEVRGEVGAVSVYKQPLDEISSPDEDVTVRRRYYNANTPHDRNGVFQISSAYEFEQGDLVRVQLWIDYSKKAVHGSYQITDYLPSGLEFVADSAKIWSPPRGFGTGHAAYASVEGQKVTFFDHNSIFNSGRLYYYYARVISPGTFKAEGPLVQNLNIKDLITVGGDDVVVVSN